MSQLKSSAGLQSKVVNIKKEDQFEYLGRWVNKSTFRAFVYDREGNETLASSYENYEKLISSGIWFAVKPEVSIKRKQKDGANS